MAQTKYVGTDALQETITKTKELLADKVDKVTGKGLSTNDYTDADALKLSGIEAGAEVNVQADWDAASGDAFIKNKPTLGDAASKNTGTGAGNIPVLDSNGKLSEAVLPSLAISDTFVVSSEAAMLALNAQVGDVAVRTDNSKSYILQATPASTLSNWVELKSPASPVQSVNGQTGAVTGLEETVNKVTTFSNPTDTQYPSAKLVSDQLATKANASDAVTDVTYDSSSKKIKKTKNGTTTDVVEFGANAFNSTAIPTTTDIPTSGSAAALTSGGAYTALAEKVNTSDLVAITTAEVDAMFE